MQLRHAHVIAGVFVLAAFVLTGQYMHWGLGHLRDVPDAPRLLYRSSHIYLMFAGACNLALGLYMRMHTQRLAMAMQVVGSALLLISPLLLGLSFFLESPAPERDFQRPLAAFGTYLAFAGVLLQGASAWVAARRGGH
jgi:hypothetical protein